MIPAARKIKIQIVWLNWGLTEEDLETIPPGAVRVFGWRAKCDAVDYDLWSPRRVSGEHGMPAQYGETQEAISPGTDLGEVIGEDGTRVNAGRALMKGTWNAELYSPLKSAFQEGQLAARPDVTIHKKQKFRPIGCFLPLYSVFGRVRYSHSAVLRHEHRPVCDGQAPGRPL